MQCDDCQKSRDREEEEKEKEEKSVAKWKAEYG